MDGDQPELSSEEMIRRARRDLESTASSSDAGSTSGEETPTPAEPDVTEPDLTEPDLAGPPDTGSQFASGAPPTTSTPPPPLGVDAQPPGPAPGPYPESALPGRAPSRMWFTVAGILIFGVGALVLLALIRGSGSVASIDAGDCFQDPGVGEISRLDTLDCIEPHDFESIGRVELNDGPYPGDIGIVVGAVEKCLALFEPYVGRPFDQAGLLVDAFVPTEGSWNDGDRDALCVVFQADDQFNPVPRVGSASGAG